MNKIQSGLLTQCEEYRVLSKLKQNTSLLKQIFLVNDKNKSNMRYETIENLTNLFKYMFFIAYALYCM